MLSQPDLPTIEPWDSTSLARRVRGTTIQIAILISGVAFLILGGGDFVDQWISGGVSAIFIVGTALINAGACLALFGVIAAVGWAISSAVAHIALRHRG
jgi:hypothetical protein